jgi:metal-sulfur cluster biosynthetic enzyme
MANLNRIRTALERVVDPCSIATGRPINLPDMGMIKDIVDDDGDVLIALRLTSPVCWQAANIVEKVEEVIMQVPGVRNVRCILDTEQDWMPDMMAPTAREELRKIRPTGRVV